MWKLSATISKGASCQHLRQRLFQVAEERAAYKNDGCILYASAVTAASDIACELYFLTVEQAQSMETDIREAVRDRWRCDALPITSVAQVFDVDVAALRRVYADHYDRAASPPDRVTFEHLEDLDSASHATTVLDAEEINRESVVDSEKVTHKFERCHIDAIIKGSRADTTGNWIPLPSNWHDFFDGYTNNKVASISIVAAPDEKGEAAPEADGRSRVCVHVYFDPRSPDAVDQAKYLRDAVLVRQNVFAVTVWKKEAATFVKLLLARHIRVTQAWSRIP